MASTSSIEPSNKRLQAILDDIRKGHIKIPAFQRGFVWEDEQIVSLLDSIYNGYPVGSALFWSAKAYLAHERNLGGFALPDTQVDYPVNYVLDGQQRLTTLFAVFHSNAPTTDEELAQRFKIAFDPAEKRFASAASAGANKTIPLVKVLDTTALITDLVRFNDDEKKSILAMHDRFKDYEFPSVTIRERTNQEVCKIFQRINSSGTKLSTLDLLTAWTWTETFDLRREIEELLDTLEKKGFEEVDERELMRCLAVIIDPSIGADDLVNVEPDKLHQAMLTLKQSMHKTVDFLSSDFRIRNYIFLPFPIMLVPIVYFFSTIKKPDAKQLRQLKKWFWQTTFSQRYKAGTTRLVNEDISKLERVAAGEVPFDASIPALHRAFFLGSWRINSTAAKAAICLLAQINPISLVSGKAVDLSNALSSYNSRQFHHIYPKAFLSSLGIGFHAANVIANICILTAEDNNFISDESPAVYFPKVDDSIKTAAFGAALIPSDVQDGNEQFAKFLEKRGDAMVAVAKQLMTQ